MKRWGDKSYHSLDWELKQRFGQKVYRLALNGGTTCPNRDGKIGTGGCIFCSAGGSGDFAGHAGLTITKQMETQKKLLSSKRPSSLYIAYFQAYTATYGPLELLERNFTEAMEQPDVAVLSVATRPDCLPEEVLDLLSRLNRDKPVWVELGLQTMHEDTARFIRRGYDLPVFEKAVRSLRERGIEVIVHTILGLPGECGPESGRVLETMRYLNTVDIQGIKLQLLHVLRGTDLAAYYFPEETGTSAENVMKSSAEGAADPAAGPDAKPEAAPTAAPDGEQADKSVVLPYFAPLGMDEYIDLVIECLETLRPDIVIHRLTGDGPADLLIAPTWSRNKRTVLNEIHHRMKEEGVWQGKLYEDRQR